MEIHFWILVKTPRGATATETGFQQAYRKAAKARRQAAKSLFEEQNLAYWHRHCYFDS